MKPQITIQNATLEDVDTMSKWGKENQELWGSNETKWNTKKSLRKWLSDIRNDLLLVAKDGDKIVGMSTTHNLRDWAMCDGLFVEKNYRNLGIGKLLINTTIEKLRKQGVDVLMLLCETENIKAFKFYKKVGFNKGHSFHWMEKIIKIPKDTK